jgi:hypothetical protein
VPRVTHPDQRNREQTCLGFSPMGNPPKIPQMGTLSGIGHPAFCQPFRDGNLIGHSSGGRDRRASFRLWWRWIVPSIRESRFGKGVGLLFE